MSDELGYHRSGRKCRKKFENLHKYYKKTKEGKTVRQDGKHYRFFRQLEALYGEQQNNNNNNDSSEYHLHGGGNFHYTFHNKEPSLLGEKLSEPSLSFSNYSEANTTSSDDTDRIIDNDDNDPNSRKRTGKKKKRSWKVKIRDFIDAHMKKLMDKHEAWMDKMMTDTEDKEHERMRRDEDWRKQDATRIEREHEFWARERARVVALMDALQKLSENGTKNPNDDNVGVSHTGCRPKVWSV